MPKTKRRPHRQATADAWSLSSDDDASLAYSSKPKRTTLPRQRHYGKQRPLKTTSGKGNRNDSAVAKRASSFEPKKRLSSKSTSKSSSRPRVNRTNDDSSSEEESPEAPKKRTASRTVPEKRPSKAFKSTSKGKKLVIEDIADSSSDDEESSNERSPPSYPAFTPIVPKRKPRENKKTRTPKPSRGRSPIRVNLTPTRNDTPKGWLTKSQLLDVARKHNGMAIQYRVMYHQAQKPIRDNNAGATRKIRYRDVVVQTRFACTTGSFGGSTYSFMRWKLPGTLLQARNAKHVTIYQDTRPRLLEQGSGAPPSETSHPLIHLCGELKDADRRMAERFLCNAEAGVTPEQFYSQLTNTKAPNPGDNGQEETNEDSAQVSQDECGSADVAVGGYGEEEEENEPPPARMSSKEKSRRDKQLSKPLREQNNIEKSKRGREEDSDDKAAKRARKKGYGGSRNRRRKELTLQIGEEGSSLPQFLALVEGVSGANSTTRGPEDKAEDYIRDVFMNGRVEKLPTAGRMLELPGEAKPGKWTAKLVDTKDRASGSSGKGLMRDKMSNLKDSRILLRHESAKDMGPLKLSRSDADSPLSQSSSARVEARRIRGGGGQSVSLINPTNGRRHNLLAQGIVSREILEDSFIGSISIAGFDGFTSSADARLSAESKSASLLESCRKMALTSSSKGSLEDVLPIPSSSSGHNVGVSFVCKIAALEDPSYGLLVSHDEDGRIVAVDVVFDQALVENGIRSSLSSTSSYQNEPSRLTENTLRRHSQEMELAVQENSVVGSSEYSDDGAGMILDDDSKPATMETPTLSTLSSKNAPRATTPTSAVAKSGQENVEVDRISTAVAAHPTPSSYFSKHTPYGADVTNEEESVVSSREEDRVVTIDPAPSTSPRHSGTTSALPTSILKKPKFGQVTPAVGTRDKASFSGEVVRATSMSLPAITPTPSRDKSRGLLPELPVDRADTANDEGSDDSDVFEDPLNEGLDAFDAYLDEDKISSEKDQESTSSSVSRWPSVHAYYGGLYDEDEYVECTVEEMRDYSAAPEVMAEHSIVEVLHEFFFGPDDEDICDDDDDALFPLVSSRRKMMRGRTHFSSIRVRVLFGIVALLWSANFVPNDRKIAPTAFSRPSVLDKASSSALFDTTEEQQAVSSDGSWSLW